MSSENTSTTKQMLPEVAEYFRIKDQDTDAQIGEKINEIFKTYNEKDDAWNADNRRNFIYEVDTVGSEIKRTKREAALKALRSSEDKLVQFIVEYALDGYPTHSEMVLKALPATMEEIDLIAIENNWCSEYTNLIERAQRRGVLPESRPLTDAEKKLDRWVSDNWTGNRMTRRTVVNFARLIAAETVAAQNAETENTTAEDATVVA